jgi:hypothetical protein
VLVSPPDVAVTVTRVDPVSGIQPAWADAENPSTTKALAAMAANPTLYDALVNMTSTPSVVQVRRLPVGASLAYSPFRAPMLRRIQKASLRFARNPAWTFLHSLPK